MPESGNLTQEGGNRWPEIDNTILAIADALEQGTDDEIRESMGLGPWRVVTDELRDRYGTHYAPIVYAAICEVLRAAITTDYRRSLTVAERADIEQQVEAAQGPAWDGVIPPDLQQDIDWATEDAIAEGRSQQYIDALRQDLIDWWLADNGYSDVQYTPEELAGLRAKLVAEKRNEKKPTFNELGSINIRGFFKVTPYRRDLLYPTMRWREFKGGGVPVKKAEIFTVDLSLVGIDAGYGELPVNLSMAFDPTHLFAVALDPISNHEFSLERYSIRAIRPRWLYTVQCDFSNDEPSRTLEVNGFPGYVLAHVVEVLELQWVNQYQQSPVPISQSVVAYLTKSEATELAESWGLSITDPNHWVLAVGSTYHGEDHIGDQYQSEALYGSLSAASIPGYADVEKGWQFDFSNLGMDSAATPEQIQSFFPRSHKVGRWGQVRGAGLVEGFRWVSADEWSDEQLADDWLYRGEEYALPPRVRKSKKRVGLRVEWSPSVIDYINASEEPEGEGEGEGEQ